MNHLKSLLGLSAAVFLCGQPLPAQTVTGTLVTITTTVPGMRFSVDGTVYTQSAAFTWVTGSKHILDIPPVYDNPGTKSSFAGWTDTTGALSTDSRNIAVTADPSITHYVAAFSQQYQISLQFSDDRIAGPLNGPPSCGAGGTPPQRPRYQAWFAWGMTAIGVRTNTGLVREASNSRRCPPLATYCLPCGSIMYRRTPPQWS